MKTFSFSDENVLSTQWSDAGWVRDKGEQLLRVFDKVLFIIIYYICLSHKKIDIFIRLVDTNYSSK